MDLLNEFINLDNETRFAIGLLLMIAFFVIAIWIFRIVYTWKLYKKAGKRGWEAIIPFYNTWVLTEIAEVNWWWFLILILSQFVSFPINMLDEFTEEIGPITGLVSLTFIVAIVHFIANLVVSINLAKKFNRNTDLGVLIAIFPIIGMPILAFGKEEYNKFLEVPGNGVFGGKSIKKDINNETNKTSVGKCQNCENSINSNMKYCNNCGVKLK